MLFVLPVHPASSRHVTAVFFLCHSNALYNIFRVHPAAPFLSLFSSKMR